MASRSYESEGGGRAVDSVEILSVDARVAIWMVSV